MAESLGLAYLSTGALLREELEKNSPLGRQVRPILARGEYVPDELMCPILADWLKHQSGGWVLDGFPRSLPQAEFLDEILAASGTALSGAIALEVPVQELLGRIRDRVECPDCRWTGQRAQLDDGLCPACGAEVAAREDDSEENFRSRHAEFEQHTLPVIEYYRGRGILLPCDATAPQPEVASRLLSFFPSPELR
jgi:adenylate kinase